MKKIKNPHDRVFKELLKEKIFAKAFVRQHFSKGELSHIDIASMKLCNASFEGEENSFHSDVIYKVDIAKTAGYYNDPRILDQTTSRI